MSMAYYPGGEGYPKQEAYPNAPPYPPPTGGAYQAGYPYGQQPPPVGGAYQTGFTYGQQPPPYGFQQPPLVHPVVSYPLLP